ncbi:MAG: T9SS type A sorting domain-containing protein [Bacteroidales bacterium]|nr:T9SS type A sorting domain-containing protein [Bacteroidales bacterium]
MKKIAIILVLLSNIVMSYSQTSSYCTVNPILRDYYTEDVKDITLKWIYESESPYMDSIQIPASIENDIWHAMAAIFNLNYYPERDSVFDKYCIHQWPRNYFIQEVLIVYDPSYSWTNNWQNHILETGIASLDSLISLYEFDFSSSSNYSDMIVIKTPQDINIRPLLNLFREYEGIIYADPNIMMGGGNKITYHNENGVRYLDFSKKWGDCMAGCIYSHVFQFQVNTDCSIEYLGTQKNWDESDPLDEPYNCNITAIPEGTITSDLINIFPNPAKNYLYIESKLFDHIEYEIRSLSSVLLEDGQIKNKSFISVSQLKTGVYLLYLKDTKSNNSSIHKFIKQ